MDLSVDAVKAIAHSLRRNASTALTYLRLVGCSVDDCGAARLAAMLRYNSVLKKLDLMGNPIHESEVRAVTEALERNTTISVYLEAVPVSQTFADSMTTSRCSVVPDGEM